MEIDPKTGKYKLSHRALLPKPEGYVERERRPRREGRRDDRYNNGERHGDHHRFEHHDTENQETAE